MIGAMEKTPSASCFLVTHEFKCAASRIAADATAFGLRRDHVLVEIVATFADRAGLGAGRRHPQWVEATRKMLDEIALPGGYANMMTGDDAARVAQSYGSNGPRLVDIKRRYDPDNVFNSAIPLPTG